MAWRGEELQSGLVVALGLEGSSGGVVFSGVFETGLVKSRRKLRLFGVWLFSESAEKVSWFWCGIDQCAVVCMWVWCVGEMVAIK